MDRTPPAVLLLASFLFGLLATPVVAADPPPAQCRLGWDGHLVVGRWNPVTAAVTTYEAGQYSLEVAALDSVGHTVRYLGPAVSLAPTDQPLSSAIPANATLTGVFQLGRLEGTVTARVLKDGKPISEQILRPGVDAGVPPVMKVSDRLFVVVGAAKGLDELTHVDEHGQPARVTVVKVADLEQLPTSPWAYDSVQAVLLSGNQQLSEPVLSALLQWVRQGGRLIVSVSKDVAGWSTNPLRSQLPVGVGAESIVVRELGTLEVFAGRNVRIPSTGRLAVAKLEVRDGQVLAGSREEPLLVSAPLGLGEVTVLALDLTQPPLANWSGLSDFNARLLKVSAASTKETSRRGQQVGQLTTTGITDLASQVVASQDHIITVRGASPWLVMGWLLLYIAIVGPIDYFLVHYVLRRPGWTWATVLVSALGFGWIATQSVHSATPKAPLVKQLDVLDLDVAGQSARHRTWITHYSPITTRLDWAFEPATVYGTASVPMLSPFSAPEAAFGGMYRAPGSEWGRTDYTIETAKGNLFRTPVLERSTQTWLAAWHETGVNLLQSDLRADGLGRLTGTMTHHFQGDIHYWLLAFGNRVYRLQDDRNAEEALPWKPGEELSLEDSRVYQRELRGLLTGTIARLEKSESRTTGTFRNEQSRYDPQVRDPLAIWQTITFHTEAGGEDYTTLSNELLHTDDFSRQLDLGRAVLFGRLAAPPQLAAKQDGQAIPPPDLTVIVRVVIPVGRSTEIQQTLPKLVK